MAINILNLPILDCKSFKEANLNKDSINENQNYIIKNSTFDLELNRDITEIIAFKRFIGRDILNKTSLDLEFNGLRYGIVVNSIPKFYTLDLGIKVYDFTNDDKEHYFVDENNKKIYMKLFIHIKDTYGKNVNHVQKSSFYDNNGLNISLNLHNANKKELLIYSKKSDRFVFESKLDYDDKKDNYNITLKNDVVEFEIRDKEKFSPKSKEDSTSNKSFGERFSESLSLTEKSNDDIGWILAAVIGGILILGLIGIFIYYRFSKKPTEYDMMVQGYNPKSLYRYNPNDFMNNMDRY
jgi:hypothetical protein